MEPKAPVKVFKLAMVAVRPVKLVAVAALPVVDPELPVTLPEIGLVTVSPVSVPTDVIFVCAAPVTVAALPVTLPAIGLVTVSPLKVPTEVKDEDKTFEARVAPVKVPAGAADRVAREP